MQQSVNGWRGKSSLAKSQKGNKSEVSGLKEVVLSIAASMLMNGAPILLASIRTDGVKDGMRRAKPFLSLIFAGALGAASFAVFFCNQIK